MLKVLLIVVPIVLILGGLGYWRYSASKSDLNTPKAASQEDIKPIEVPKTLPQASIDERVKAIEDVVNKLVAQVNNLSKSQTTQTSTTTDTKVAGLETSITELKVRLALLEKSSPTSSTTSSSKYPLYIPIGSSSSSWNPTDWTSLGEFETSINADSYTGYTNMQLEVNFRLVDPSGTASVRLYNVTDGTAVNSQIDTTSTTFALRSSGTFTLPTGAKTYRIQVKSSIGKDVYIQTARVKVNF